VDNVARVVLALEAHDVAEEVMHFLDRSGCARVVATAADDRQLNEAVRQLEPDVVIAQPALVDPAAVRGAAILALETRESVASLRSAIRIGASGFYLWPGDREALATGTAASMVTPASTGRRASVIAVHAARGGAGATFVATHLAAALAHRGATCTLIDADPLYGDVSAAVGAPVDDVHTFADLLPLVGELTTEHLDEALWTHADGFRVLLAPAPERAAAVRGDDVRDIVEAAAGGADVVVVHLPRSVDHCAQGGLSVSDRVLEVLSLDVLSFRAATRALEALEPLGVRGRVGFVVNRAARSEITPGDVTRVFGVPPLAVLPFDRAVGRAQDHGRILPARGRVGRAFDRLANEVLEPVVDAKEGS
jgi:Flp pilus assembly CpaE family ATPase